MRMSPIVVGNKKMKKKETACPDCGSTRVVSGRYLGQMDCGLGQVFRPSGLKALKLSLTRSDIPVSDRFQACLDCGLFWNRANGTRIEKTIVALGKKATKEKLGL